MAIEKTFIMIKPDAVRDRKIGEIVTRIERIGLVHRTHGDDHP